MTKLTFDLVKNGTVETTLILNKDTGDWYDIDPPNTKLTAPKGNIEETATQFRCYADGTEIVRLHNCSWEVQEGESRTASCKSCKPLSLCSPDPDWVCTGRE